MQSYKMRVLVVAVIVATVMVVFVSATIQAPKVAVNLNVGDETTTSTGSSLGMEPSIQWQTGGSVSGVDFSVGIDVKITDKDTRPPPEATSFWGGGKAKKKVPAHQQDDSSDSPVYLESVDLDLGITSNGFGSAFQILGRYDGKSNKVEFTKLQMANDIDANFGTFSINQQYDVQNSSPDVRLGFTANKLKNTNFEVDTENKQLAVSQTFGGGGHQHTITPAVTTSGDFSLSYRYNHDAGTLTTVYAPKDSVKVLWRDGDKCLTFKAPLEGYYNINQGIKLSVGRE